MNRVRALVQGAFAIGAAMIIAGGLGLTWRVFAWAAGL